MGNIIKNINLFKSLTESTTWYPYRVKTEKELIEEFGSDWRRRVFNDVGWNPAMYDMLGIDYTKEYFNLEFHQPHDEVSITDQEGRRWIIPCMALTKNQPKRIPSYKPRNFERTLESSLYKFHHKEIGIKIKNEDELIEIQDNLKKIGEVEQNLETKIRRYPNYLFVDVWEYEKSGKIILCYLTDDRDVESAFERLVLTDTSIYQHMFDISEWDKIESIMKYGRENAIPNYKPKKIERTLESTTWYPYRFRTEQEMEDKFGYNWRNSEFEGVGWNDGGHLNMDYFLGRVYERTIDEIEKFQEGSEDYEYPSVYDDTGKEWWAHKDMFTDNKPQIPNYNPRKIERTLESTKFNPYMLVSCNNRKDCLEFEDFLHKIGWTYPSGSKYILTHYSSMNEVTFNHFNMNNKTFDGLEGLKVGNDVFNYSANKEKVRQIFHPTPSYKPKRIDRTLENLNETFKFIRDNDTVAVQLTQPKFLIGDEVTIKGNGLGLHIDGISVCYIEMDPVKEWIKDNIGKKLTITEFAYEPLYNMWVAKCKNSTGDYNYIHQDALKKLIPDYKPRKIDRTLEGKTLYPYRFKTKEEFEEEYGPRWRNIVRESWVSPHMDELFGKDVPSHINEDNISMETVNTRQGNGWCISMDMITRKPLKPLVPSYAPRKIDRTLESIENNQYRFKTRQEFIKDFGENYKTETGWGRFGDMDYLFGKKLSDVTDKNVDIEMGGLLIPRKDNPSANFYISMDWLTTEPLKPYYTPKKFDRTIEGSDFENSLIKKIQSVLTKDLLVPEWADKLKVGKHHPFAGHCYAASEALYHLLGGKEKGYKAMRGKGLNNETHWWIVDKNGNILNPTSEQFYFVGLKPPYENGKGTGYLTKNPSKRAKEIISRIQNI